MRFGPVSVTLCAITVVVLSGGVHLATPGTAIPNSDVDTSGPGWGVQIDVDACTNVEADDIPLTITRTGRYCLTEDVAVPDTISVAIDVQVPGVTVDLRRHTISSPFFSVLIAGGNNVEVKDGTVIHDDPTVDGIQLGNNAWVHHVVLKGPVGLIVGDRSTVTDVAHSLTSQAPSGTDDVVEVGGQIVVGDYSYVARTHLSYSGDNAGDAIRIGSGCVVEGNMLRSPLGDVIVVQGDGNTVRQNTIDGGGMDSVGVTVQGNGNLILDNNISDMDWGGITVSGVGNKIDSNHIHGADVGIQVTGTDNVIIRNSAHANTPFNVGAGNDLGPVGTAAESTSPWANIAF